jgi:hypothetical protein
MSYSLSEPSALTRPVMDIAEIDTNRAISKVIGGDAVFVA